MAATLDCVLSGGTGGSAFTYALQAENVTVSLRRSPLHIALTGVVITQDFGITAPTVTLRGVVPTVSPGSDGTNTICNKDQLEDAIVSEYAPDLKITLGAGTGASTTSSYTGKVQNVSFALVPGKEQIYWTFNLTLVTGYRGT